MVIFISKTDSNARESRKESETQKHPRRSSLDLWAAGGHKLMTIQKKRRVGMKEETKKEI